MKVLLLAFVACSISAAKGSAIAWPGAIDVSNQVPAAPAAKALYIQPGTKSFAFSTTQFLHALPIQQKQFLAYPFAQLAAAPTLDSTFFSLPLLGSAPFSGNYIFPTPPFLFSEKPAEGDKAPPKIEGESGSQTSTEKPQEQPPANVFPSFPSSSQDFPTFPQIQIPEVFPPNFPQFPQIPNLPQLPQFPQGPSNPQTPQNPQPSAPAESTPVDNTNLSFNGDDTVSIESA